MKIGSSLDNTALPATGAAGTGAARGTAAAGGSAATAALAATASVDTVDLSAAGARIGALSQNTDFDSAKVDAIRQAIREGRFTVNPGAIADKLIADAAALLGPRTH